MPVTVSRAGRSRRRPPRVAAGDKVAFHGAAGVVQGFALKGGVSYARVRWADGREVRVRANRLRKVPR